jgi:hypothetical protein
MVIDMASYVFGMSQLTGGYFPGWDQPLEYMRAGVVFEFFLLLYQ